MLKIGIIPCFQYLDSEGDLYDKYGPVLYDWGKILKINKQKHVIPIEKDFFDEVKLLENNEELEREILKFRKKFNVPDDVVAKPCKSYRGGKDIKFVSKKYPNWDWDEYLFDEKFSLRLEKKERYFERIKKQFQMPRWLSDDDIIYYQLEYLFVGNVVVGGFGSYGISHFKDDSDMGNFMININTQVSKYELIKYIERNWKDMQKLISTLPEKGRYEVSKRDRRIFELRKEGKKYSEIADVIAEEFSEDSGDEAIIKIAYQRLKKKIGSMFYRRKKNKKGNTNRGKQMLP